MMKKFSLIAIVIFLLSFALVHAATNDLNIESVIIEYPNASTSAVPGDIVDIKVNVKNNGVSTINAINVVSTNLLFGINTITAPTSTVVSSLSVGQTKTGTLRLTVPSILSGSYVGTVQVKDASDTSSNVKESSYAVILRTVDGLDVLTISEASPLVVTTKEDQTLTRNFTVKNTGTSAITLSANSFTFLQGDFDDGEKVITLGFSPNPAQINPGQQSIVTLTINIPNKLEVGNYKGVITVNGNSAKDTFNLEINVNPEVCEDGPVGTELALDINDPDDGDDFAPGDTIKIDTTVDNNGNNRKDVVVEAFLYNVNEDEEVERVELDDSVRIDDDDEEDIELELKIPFDDEISEDDDYILFVKAFEDGDEDEQCVEKQLDIKIEREDHDVRVDKITITPGSVVPGDSVDITVSIVNVGSKEEDGVTVKLNVPEFGWDETSNSVDLDDGESKDKDAVLRFSDLKIPKNVDKGTYSVTATVIFDDGDGNADNFAQLNVVEGEVTGEVAEAKLETQSVSDSGDNAFSITALVTNEGGEEKTFTAGVLATWAQSVSDQTFTLGEGDSKIVQFVVNAKESTSSGAYSGTITLKESGNVIASKTFNVAVKGKETEEESSLGGFFSGLNGTVLFVIVDIVLIVIAVFFIRLIFKSGSRKKAPTEKVKL